MDNAEVNSNLKDLERKLERELDNAELEDKNNSSETIGPEFSRLAVNTPKLVVRFACDFKNRIKKKIITKDMGPDDIALVEDLLKTGPEEIEIYKSLIDEIASEFTPEEYKAWLNKWFCNPVILKLELAIEFEIKSALAIRNKILAAKMSNKAA